MPSVLPAWTAREREQFQGGLTDELARRSGKASDAAQQADAAENTLRTAQATAAATAEAARCALSHGTGWKRAVR